MAQTDILKRYLDAGVAFTQMTRERAEAIVQDLVKAGELRRREAEKNIEMLVERSRRNTEELMALVRREVVDQLRAVGLDDLARRAGLGEGEGAAPGGGAAGADTPNAASATQPVPDDAAPVVRAMAKKAAAKKAGATKAGAAKTPVAKTPVAKTPVAKKAGAAKKSAKKSTR